MPRRFTGLALLALSLAGCFGAGDSGSAGYRPYTAVARFLPGDEVTVIQVLVSDRQALRGADLIGPGGTVIAADSIEVRQGADTLQPSFRPSIGSAIGVAPPPGLYGSLAPGGSQTVTSGQIQSTALIRLSDPVSYLKDWRFWQVRLRIGDPPNVNVLSLPAPQPPATL
jgi:hypothetical protein